MGRTSRIGSNVSGMQITLFEFVHIENSVILPDPYPVAAYDALPKPTLIIPLPPRFARK